MSLCFHTCRRGNLSDSIETKMLADFYTILSFCRAKSNKLRRFRLIGYRTHRKVPVRLCLITEKMEQQSDQFSLIEFD